MNAKHLIFIKMIVFPLILYSQYYQFEITDEFELKNKDLSYLTFEQNKLFTYDSTENRIYIIDSTGTLLDSLSLNLAINGMDVYNDTLYVQKNILLNKESTILKINHQNGEVCDSIVWAMGDNADYASLLCVDSNYMICYISAGWSSNIVLIDRLGTVSNSILIAGLGMPVDLSFISSDKFCLISNTGSNKNGYYSEYEISSNIIKNIAVSEIPVTNPKGVSSVNDSTFYVYSGNENKVYKLIKRKSVTNNDIQRVIEKDIIIYPNPTSHILRIESDIEINKIEILKTDGPKMALYPNERLIYLQEYPKGIYLVVLSTEYGKVVKSIIVK